jgi:hypothetical protein
MLMSVLSTSNYRQSENYGVTGITSKESVVAAQITNKQQSTYMLCLSFESNDRLRDGDLIHALKPLADSW